MKKLMLCALLTIGIVYSGHSINCPTHLFSSDTIPPITTFQESGEVFYKVPLERAKIIDLWGRRGVEAKIGVEAQLRAIYMEQLMNQIRVAKISADSTSMALSRDLYNVRGEVTVLAKDNTNLQKGLGVCQTENEALKKENKQLKAKIFWKDFSKIVTYIGMGLAAAVLITN